MRWGNLDSINKKVWGPWGTVGWGILIFIGWCIFQSIPAVFILSTRLQTNPQDSQKLLHGLVNDGFVLTLGTIVGCIAGLGLIWGVIKIQKGDKPSDYLALIPLELKTVLKVLGFGAVFFIAGDLLTIAFGKDVVPPVMVNFYKTCGSPALFCLGVILFGPVFEEFYFRGFLFEGFRNSKLGNVGAAILTSAAWASLHMQYEMFFIVFLFFTGLVIAYLRIKTRSLWGCVVFHVFMNAWSMIEMILSVNGFTLVHR